MQDIYICHTPYHLLIALCKVLINDKTDSELVLCQTKLIPQDMIHRLKSIKAFAKIYEHTDMDACVKTILKKINNYHRFDRFNLIKRRKKNGLLIQEHGMNIELHNKNVYIFNDSSYMGIFLNYHRIAYHLLEDGLNCYRNPVFLSYIQEPIKWKRYLKCKMGLIFESFGFSPFTKSVEVNSKEQILLQADNVVELSRTELFSMLNDNQKKTIVQVFMSENEVLYFLNLVNQDLTLLITQPLCVDKITDYDKQICIYQRLINEYGIGKVLIKPHPRDCVKYGELFPDCLVLDNRFIPIEVLNFLGIKIKRVVTAFSTAVEQLEFCEEKISMGYDWVQNFDNI